MGAPVLSPWLAWALIGFGPSVIALCFGIRALRRDTGSAWADSYDISTFLDWITPGLAVLAVLSLVRTELSRSGATVCGAGPILAYVIAAYLPIRLSSRWREMDIDRLTSARMFVVSYARLLTIAFVLSAQGVIYSGFATQVYAVATGGMPTLTLFVSIVVVGRIGEYALTWLAPNLGKWKALAPGDLYKRVVAIAARSGVDVDDVRILKQFPDGFVNAIAHSGSSIGFGEELVTGLNKDEVDAVIAHEVGHLGDTVLWHFSYPAFVVAALAWYGGVRFLERMIMSSDLRFLQYANWMAMFVLPGLVIRWYSRYCERKADANIAVLENPEAAISGYYKLALLNHRPVSRPWWSRLLSTHPTLQEDIDTIAHRAGLTVEQVDEARCRAEVEVQSGPSDRYDIAYHEEPESPIEKRGRELVDVAVILGAVFAGALTLAASIWLAMSHDESWWTAVILLVGVLATALVIILPIDTYQKRKNARLLLRIRAKLASRYGDDAVSSMLLVDACLSADDQVWQGALIGVRDGELVLLAESQQVAIPLDAGLRVEGFTNDNSFGDNARMVMVWYEVSSVRQFAIVRILGQPEKGSPRNRKELERYVRDLITGAGGTITVPRRAPVRQVLVRAPIALLILAAVAGLVQLLASLAGLEDALGIHVLVLVSTASGLYYWVTKKPSAEKPREPDTSL